MSTSQSFPPFSRISPRRNNALPPPNPHPVVNQPSAQELCKYLREIKVAKALGSGLWWGSRFQGRGMMRRFRKRIATDSTKYSCLVDRDGKESCEGSQMRKVDC